ncbi:phosphoribosylanthranilate isomerase [SAR202 cluster bacterium AC-409-J13_OGT_754m]|nr:phosphoribosylanthranilate isomerase [SAR202 cluster bacterium AC-409-J13_OGT_754m]
MQLIKVKICGIRTTEAALHATEEGADFVGMIFVPNRRRSIAISDAKNIVERLQHVSKHRTLTVGLFANQPISAIIEISERVGLDMVQLCGDEPLEYCDQIPIPLIKSVHVPKQAVDAEFVEGLAIKLEQFSKAGHIIALDTLVDGLEGGTGSSFNWDIANHLSKDGYEFMLSGGLDPDNLATAIEKIRPWGVDVSSGVETEGEKDEAKISAFIAICRQLPATSGWEGGT